MQEAIFSLVPSSAGLAELIQLARTYVEAGRSVATRRAEASDWRDFEVWCGQKNLQALPAIPETVALYLSDRASALAYQRSNAG